MVTSSEFLFDDRVPFSANDSGSLWKCTNQSQSLPHFVTKNNSLVTRDTEGCLYELAAADHSGLQQH